jgi:hypothetical protein
MKKRMRMARAAFSHRVGVDRARDAPLVGVLAEHAGCFHQRLVRADEDDAKVRARFLQVARGGRAAHARPNHQHVRHRRGYHSTVLCWHGPAVLTPQFL